MASDPEQVANKGGSPSVSSAIETSTNSKLSSFEDVLELVGTKGSYNVLVIVACAAVGLMTPMQVLSAGFLGATADHWCHVPELVAANWTTEQIRAFASPQNESCSVLDYNFTTAARLGYDVAMADSAAVGGGTLNVSCFRRDFDKGVQSIVTEWDLVCERLPLYTMTIAAAQVGMFCGSIIFGYLLDRVGRRRGMLLSISLFVPCGLLQAASVNVYMYMIFKICVTMVGIGMYLGGFVLSMELCTPDQRSLVSSYFVIPWAIGYMLTAVIAYGFTYWRYLQVALTLPAVLLFLNFFLVPESPRWLSQRGSHEEALQVLAKMAARNKRPLPPDAEMIDALRRINPPPADADGPWSMRVWTRKWVIPQLQWKTPVVFFSWFAVAMVYYGVSQGASNFGINEYLFIFVGGVLEIVSYLFIWPGVAYLGRRACLVSSFLVSAGSLLGVMALTITGNGDSGWLSFFSYLGKFMITASFHLVYIVTGELFTTSLRSLMIGESSVCARCGSILSPFINVLMGSGINNKWVPSAFFGAFSLVAGLLCLLLPETRGVALDAAPAPVGIDNEALELEKNGDSRASTLRASDVGSEGST